MSLATARRAVSFLLDEGHERVALSFFGGEPLLERAAIEAMLPELVALGRSRGALVTAKVSTNGALLDASFARFARRHALFVSLSADGTPRAQDAGRPTAAGAPSSPRVERALASLVEEHAAFCTYSVITPAMVGELAASVDWLFERGSRVLISTLDFEADWDEASFAELERQYAALAERYLRWTRDGVDFLLAPFDSKIAGHTRAAAHRESCAAGVRQVAVDPEGFLYPCIEFLESPEFRIGNVDSGIDRAAWKALNVAHGGARPDECGGCGIRSRCGSSCACLNYRTAGKTRAVDALLCAHERAATLAADRIGAALWREKSRAFLERQYEPHHRGLQTLEAMLKEVVHVEG